MDDIVKAALAKWPNVPACFGWLALDARGDWYMRDDRTQALGSFPGVKGSRIEHDKLLAFIHRNYLVDTGAAVGCWFFQNGPQKVYVELEAAPLVWRLAPGEPGRLHAHTGQLTPGTGRALTHLDELGRLFVSTAEGLGIVHTQDMHLAADWIEAGGWPTPAPTTHRALVTAHGVVLSPQQRLRRTP
jgi:hypothetical protein